MPDWNGMVPTIFSVASSMIQYCLGYDPMMRVPFPAETLGFSAFCSEAVRSATASRPARRAASVETTAARAMKAPMTANFLMTIPPLWEDQIDLAPVLLSGRALRGPVGRVIELIGHLRRPVAADVAVEQIPFDGLTQAGRPAFFVGLPAGREHERAADREMR